MTEQEALAATADEHMARMIERELDEDERYERFREAQIDAYCDQYADYDSAAREQDGPPDDDEEPPTVVEIQDCDPRDDPLDGEDYRQTLADMGIEPHEYEERERT